MIPKKIYLRETELDELSTCERMVSCDEPYNDITLEFTNLSKVWHDSSEEPEGNYWRILCQDEMNGCWVENRVDAMLLHNTWNEYAEIEMIVKWVYIHDILPKGGGE